MAITGTHALLYTSEPEALRACLRDVFGWHHVDAHEGWLIFALPPAEVAVHPANRDDRHELYLMCDDIGAFVAQMKLKNIACAPVADRGWGLLTQLALPSGGKLGVYQPRHVGP